MERYYTIFSTTYGSGPYSGCDYNGTSATCATTSGGAGGSLANTGVAVVGLASLACFLIMLALLVRFWRRKRSAQPVLQEQENSNPSDSASSVDDGSSDHIQEQ